MELVKGTPTDGTPQKSQEVTHTDMLAMELKARRSDVIRDRAYIESRWLDDLLQYTGEYDEQTLRKLKDSERSSVYLNITRTLVNQSESQLADLLFPAEDKNYGLGPTPSPEMADDLDNDSPVINPVSQEPVMDPNTEEPVTHAQVALKGRELAAKKARAMEREIDDQLVECRYASEARRALHQAAIFGTGVIVGPETVGKPRHRYKSSSEGGFALDTTIEQRVVARHVPVWDFYPDMSVTEQDQCEFFFERSYMTRKQLRRLQNDANYARTQVLSALQTSPESSHVSAAGNIDALRQLSGATAITRKNHYEMWTYRGPVSLDALRELGVALEEDDPAEELDAIVVMCGDIPIKAALNPLDTEDPAYSIFCWQNDEFGLFGYGVPWMCRNEQRILNASWRMMLDNATKSAGPQVIIKRSGITPVDGDHTIRPWKVWECDETIVDPRTAFTVVNFPSVQNEMANILSMAKQFLNETAGLPPAMGQGQGQAPTTLGGMAMLLNSSNTDRRRQVRAWDDNVTVPLISRFYHWNMQYHENEDIKGDYEVHARGSSALLLREQQAINLMGLLDKYAAHPVLMNMLKSDAALRKLVQALHIAPEDLVKTPEDLTAEAKASEGEEPPPDPQIVIEEMRQQSAQMKAELTREVEQMKAASEAQDREGDRQLRRDLALMKAQEVDRQLQLAALRIAETNKVSYQKILADLKKHRWRMNLDKAEIEAGGQRPAIELPAPEAADA